MPDTTLNVALVGPGRIAQAHLHAIAAATDRARLVAVAGLPHERSRTEELATRYGAERAVHDFGEVLTAGDIDAVVLTVPNHLHAPMAVDVLGHGKHVLVEKPLANSVAEVDAMIEAAERNSRVLMTAQCRRFFRGAQEAKHAVAQLGRPRTLIHTLGVYVEDAAVDWWKSASQAGGLAVGLNGPHVIDTMSWFIDATPTRVYAQTRRLRDRWEGEDEAVLLVEFDDGSLGTGYLSLNCRPSVNERIVNAPDGSIRLTDDRNLWIDGDQVVAEEVTPYIEGDSAFDAQFVEFASAIAEGRLPLSNAYEARRVVAIMAAVHASQHSGAPVDLQLPVASV